MRACRLLSPLTLSLSLLLGAANAHANDCPPGSLYRSEDGYSFCEPTVCQNDAQCNPEEVCRPIPLCLQVGTLTKDAASLTDAGKRLVATQQCAPDQTCPQTTVCSALGRCVSKTTAERMGILSSSTAQPSGPGDPPPKKTTCGCRAVGEGGDSWRQALVGCAVLAAALSARRARAGRRGSQPPRR
jgi:hypothetical protein